MEWIVIIPFCFLIIRLSQNITKINLEKLELIHKLEQLEQKLEKTEKIAEKYKDHVKERIANKRRIDFSYNKIEKLEQKLDEVIRYQDDDRILLTSLNTRILRLEKKLYKKSMDSWIDEETGAMKLIQKEEETGHIHERCFACLPTYKKTRSRRYELDNL